MLPTLQEKLAGTSGPVSDKLRWIIAQELGCKGVVTERVVAG